MVENKGKCMQIMMSITYSTRTNLLDEPGRRFVREGLLERQTRSHLLAPPRTSFSLLTPLPFPPLTLLQADSERIYVLVV